VAGLRVFPTPEARPRDALSGADDVAAALEARYRTQLEIMRPRDAGSLAAFAREVGPAYRRALSIVDVEPAVVRVEGGDAERVGRRWVRRLTIGTDTHGEQLPALYVTPDEGQAAGAGRPPVLLLDAGGKERWLARSGVTGAASSGIALPAGDFAPGRLLTALLDAGRAALLVDVFLTGAYLTPLSATGRPATETHFAGHNRVDVAWRAQDVLTAAAALRRLTGAPHVDALARGDAGLWCILARGAAPRAIRHLTADGAQFRWDDDAGYLERLYLPLLRRLGGLSTAVALAAPQPLTLFNAGEQVPSWLPALYEQLGAAAALVVHRPALDEDALAQSGAG
jgi:hypothetical protein